MTDTLVFEVTTDQYPQVTKGKQYTIASEYDDMVKLVGITHPVSKHAGKYVIATQQQANTFSVVRYRLVEERIVQSNTPGSQVVDDLMLIDRKDLDEYTYYKDYREVDNISEMILKLKRG